MKTKRTLALLLALLLLVPTVAVGASAEGGVLVEPKRGAVPVAPAGYEVFYHADFTGAVQGTLAVTTETPLTTFLGSDKVTTTGGF
ncbi:MAG: hypothetical protein LBR85_05405, partial [Oscillospiraceae bacterium]|nr:hypothetical protein [Oscillospiraceae bacterium]